MSEMTVNWGELMKDGAADFQPVPKGNYDVYVDSAEPKQSTTGKLMFAIKFKIENGPHAGRIVFNNVTLTKDNPNALRFFFLNMKAMGITQEFFAQNPSPAQIAQALLGAHCRIEVDHRPYQQEVRENVKAIFAPGGAFAGPGGALAGPSAPVSGLPVAGSTATSPMVPSMPQPTASPLPTPVSPVVPPATPVAAPVQTEMVSTAAIPAPTNPAPAAKEPPPAPQAPVESPLPPGFTDRAQYEAFLAFQRQQEAQAAAAAQPVTTPAPATAAPALPVPPPINF